MAYIGGSIEVQNFIKKYKKSGYLIDPYSDEWVSIAEQRNRDDEINFEGSIDTYKDHDQEFGSDYRNHLLIVYSDHYNSELIKDLKNLYQPLNYIFNETADFGTHKPDFLFINLAVKQILCVGLGRKNRLMQYDAERYSQGIHEPEIDLLDNHNSGNYDVIYAQNFKALDHDGYIERLIFDLKTLGNALVDFNDLNYHSEMYCELNDDGMWEFENGRDPVNEEELEALNNYYEIIRIAYDESIEGISVFFPKVEPADLNNLD